MQSVIIRFTRVDRLTIVFLLLVLFQSAAFGQTAGTSLSAQAGLVTELDVNGLKVIVKRRPGSATVAAGLFIRGGAMNSTTQNAGLESFMLSTATEGSVKYPRETLRREIARTGGNLSSGSNYDFSVLALASTLEDFDHSWEIFTDVAMNPAFAANDVELTREKILTALRSSEDDPDGFLQVLVNRSLNAKTSYENEPNGTIENIARFKTTDLRDYHKKTMETSRLMLVIVGDLDAAVLKNKITATLGKLPRGAYKEPVVKGFDFSKPTLDITARDLPTNYIQGVFDAPSIKSSDYYAMRVATTLLRERVFEEVRTKRNLSYAPSADMGTLSINSGNIYVTAVDANQSVSIMLNEIKELQNIPVSERDISGVAGQFLTSYFIGQETNAAQAAEIARYELVGGGWRNAFEFINRVKQVTPADVQRVSQKYMKNLRFVVLGKPASIDRNIFLQN
ncbi:MAG: insulinase family protein [Pyrinomonadaceae bacterium]|nr:insulinase family protein [Acidobacteriota bacterium]MBK7933303.1 insulinase family protein [Acidobacteriota bacterium]MBP7374849.1 insulinase family protein [Pyrinomonadaceae bacterium]